MASPSTSYRLAVASRALAALAGGYLLTASMIGALALFLPMERAAAALTATMLSFAIYACSVLWAFAARSAWLAWAVIALPALALEALLWSRSLLVIP